VAAKKPAWSPDESHEATRAARAVARGDEDEAQDTLVRMLERAAKPERAAGFAKYMKLEGHKKAKRRASLAPTEGYDPAVHDHDDADRPAVEAVAEPQGKPRAPALGRVNYAGQFAAAAANARYIASALQSESATFEDWARELAAHPGVPPHPDVLGMLANFERVQRAFSVARENVTATPAQVALSIETALRTTRSPGMDEADWIVKCVLLDWPGLALHVDAARPLLVGLTAKRATDKRLAAIASVLTGVRISSGAVKKARSRQR
jgi:hypothetical protein